MPDRAVGVGDTFAIGFLVSNGGDLPARDVVVRATYPEDALQIVGNSTLRVPYLDTSAEGVFEFTALAEGQHEMLINLAARSGVAKPMARVEVPVGHRDWSSLAVPIGASTVLVLLASGVLISRYGPRLPQLRHR